MLRLEHALQVCSNHVCMQLQLGTARPRTRGLCAGTGGGGGGLLVGKRVQEVWEKKRKKGRIIIIINKYLTGRVGVNSRLGLCSLVRKI